MPRRDTEGRARARAALVGVAPKDGKEQATYAAIRLSFFKDTKRAKVKGQGLDFFGGERYV